MGAVRTTFAMVAACIVRRKQFIERGLEDPYTATRSVGSRSGFSSVSVIIILYGLHYTNTHVALRDVTSKCTLDGMFNLVS